MISATEAKNKLVEGNQKYLDARAVVTTVMTALFAYITISARSHCVIL